jgi:hypothetical protein
MFQRDNERNYTYFTLAIAIIIFRIKARIVEIKAFISL